MKFKLAIQQLNLVKAETSYTLKIHYTCIFKNACLDETFITETYAKWNKTENWKIGYIFF